MIQDPNFQRNYLIKTMQYPIPIQTNHSVIHLYCKEQLPIIGTMMTKPLSVCIIVTETNKYCGFLSQREHEIKKYQCTATLDDGIYLKETGITQRFTEHVLIKFPSERMIPFNLHKDKEEAIIYIDFVSFPIPFAGHFDDTNTTFMHHSNGDIISHRDLTISFQLKVYQYDNYNQETEMIDSNTFKNCPKLEYMLKKIWKMEQGEEISLDNSERPPEYDDELECTIPSNSIQGPMNDCLIKTEKTIRIVPFDSLITTEDNANEFLTNYYSDEYKKYVATKKNSNVQNLVKGFLDTRLKRLLFNMHYINRIEKKQFISVFEYNPIYMGKGIDKLKVCAVNWEGFGFVTISTNKIFTYQKYDMTMKKLSFNNFFIFNWYPNENQMNNDDLFTVLNNRVYCSRIIEYEVE